MASNNWTIYIAPHLGYRQNQGLIKVYSWTVRNCRCVNTALKHSSSSSVHLRVLIVLLCCRIFGSSVISDYCNTLRRLRVTLDTQISAFEHYDAVFFRLSRVWYPRGKQNVGPVNVWLEAMLWRTVRCNSQLETLSVHWPCHTRPREQVSCEWRRAAGCCDILPRITALTWSAIEGSLRSVSSREPSLTML